jgi:ribosomal protein S18 acetylase RimI-like enzyme
MTSLRFLPIDIKQDFETCVFMRRMAFCASFESGDARFEEEYGPESHLYRQKLQELMAVDPAGFVHVWRREEIVGQLEMRLLQNKGIGYIHLFALRPDVQGQGYGDALQEFASSFFRERGVDRVQLSVSPRNQRALAYYRKHGWRDCGLRPGFPEVHLMELSLADDSM